MTLYLSDYTANTHFYNHVWGNGAAPEARDGDEFGYIKTKPKAAKEWPGPYGKMSIQLTLWDPHATFVREQVKAKDWVFLKNVSIKYGNTGGCLEGFLRRDRDAYEGKVQVEIIRQAETAEETDHRLVKALDRKLKWKRRYEKEMQGIQDEASGQKRKREDEPPKLNSKARRKERRAAVEGKVVIAEQKLNVKMDLNQNSM